MAGTIVEDGHNVPFTCENSRFVTNRDKGTVHGELGAARGSVFNDPLYQDSSMSLWLEHVYDKQDGWDNIYWLMLYDARGWPKIVMSPVLSRDDIGMMAAKMSSLLP